MFYQAHRIVSHRTSSTPYFYELIAPLGSDLDLKRYDIETTKAMLDVYYSLELIDAKGLRSSIHLQFVHGLRVQPSKFALSESQPATASLAISGMTDFVAAILGSRMPQHFR
jgi:hypothetical protein